MRPSIQGARRFYAEELRFTTGMQSPKLLAAFASVARERFLGPGPWRTKSHWNLSEYWTTPDADVRNVYHDVLVALDERLGLNNGLPSLYAYLFDRTPIAEGETVVHLGCGTGYYSAILAELVGPAGHVLAIDIHAGNVERAKKALAPWPQATVKLADGTKERLPPADLIVASAGATHPPPAWLAALKPSGRLLFPMTVTCGPGAMVLVSRLGDAVFSIRRLSAAAFYEFSGARDAGVSERLRHAYDTGALDRVKSVRTDEHAEDDACALHGQGWCLSCVEPAALLKRAR